MLLAVFWRLRYKLGLRDVSELLLRRGYAVSHETISADLRTRRHGCAGRSWYLDETYLRVAGRWCYLYWEIDRDGSLIDSRLSEHRDRSAARRFLRGLLEVSGRRPLRVTADHHGSYPKAIRWVLGRKAIHRRDRYYLRFRRYLKDSGLPLAGLHVLRHSAAKLRRDAGESIEAVSAFLDHSSLAVTTTYLRRLEGQEDTGWAAVADRVGA